MQQMTRDALGTPARRLTRTATLILSLVLPATTLAQTSDSTRAAREPLFVRRDAWIGAAFVAGTVAMFPIDRRLDERLQHRDAQENRLFHHLATDVRLVAQPGALAIGVGMYSIGRLSHVERAADLGLHGTEALLLGSAIGGIVKGVTGRARPYVVADSNPRDFKLFRGFHGGTDLSSFPSGHTIAAFAAAAAVTSETSRWWPRSTVLIAPLMYGGATAVGLSRLYNNKHWASDVVLGAAIGTFSGLKVVRYHHTHPGNRIDRTLLSVTVTPTPDGFAMALGVATR